MPKYAGFGAEIYLVEDDGSKTLIKGLHGDPDMFNEQADPIDVTSHDSPGGRREYVGGLIDSGERTLMFYYDPADPTHKLLKSSVRQVKKFQVNHPSWENPEEFEAMIVGARTTNALEGAQTLEIRLKPTGEQKEVTTP